VQPVRRFGTPLAEQIRPMPYLKLLTRADAASPSGRCYYAKARTLKHLSDEAIEVLGAYGSSCTSPTSCLLVQQIHGAASRVAPEETAFALREEAYIVNILAAWEEDAAEADQHLAWADGCWRALGPYATSGVYINFLGDDQEEQVRAAYGGNYQRLQALKQRYDPTNVFQHTQNIPPPGRSFACSLATRAGGGEARDARFCLPFMPTKARCSPPTWRLCGKPRQETSEAACSEVESAPGLTQ
jgi:hypothetical protein